MLSVAVVMCLVGGSHGWVTVSPQGRVTIKAETQIGHWELPEEVDPRKSLFVTGDVNVGRDPSNVNVWGNMTLTGIVDLTAGGDPDETILRQGAKVHLDGTDFVNGTLINATRANATQAGGGLRRLSDAQDGVTVTLRRMQDSAPVGANETCVQSQVSLQNGTALNGVLCGNETTAVYEFQPEAVDYFRRGRRAMVRPRMEAIPTVVPGTMLGRLVSSRTDLDIQSAYASDITLTPGLGGRVLVHSETEYALRAGASSMRVTTDLVNISTPGRTSVYSGQDVDITTPNLDVWSTNITAEALGSIRLVTSNFSAEMWENLNVSASEMVTATSQDAFINARDTIDASATDVSLGAGDTLDFVAQNKAAMLTTDFWLAAGHALDVFAQEDVFTSADRATTKTTEYVETSTATANLFANDSVSAFAVNGTNLVSTDLAVLAGRDMTVQVGRSTSFVSSQVRITAEQGVELDAGRQLSIGTNSFVLDAYSELVATTTELAVQANRSIEIDSVGPLRVGSASLEISANAEAILAAGGDVAAVAGGELYVSAGTALDIDVSGAVSVVGDSLLIDSADVLNLTAGALNLGTEGSIFASADESITVTSGVVRGSVGDLEVAAVGMVELMASEMSLHSTESLQASSQRVVVSTAEMQLHTAESLDAIVSDFFLSASDTADVFVGEQMSLTAGERISMTSYGAVEVASVGTASLTSDELTLTTIQSLNVSGDSVNMHALGTVEAFAGNRTALTTSNMTTGIGGVADVFVQETARIATNSVEMNASSGVALSTGEFQLNASRPLEVQARDSATVRAATLSVDIGQTIAAAAGDDFSIVADRTKAAAQTSMDLTAGDSVVISSEQISVQSTETITGSTGQLSLHVNTSAIADIGDTLEIGMSDLIVDAADSAELVVGTDAEVALGGNMFLVVSDNADIAVGQETRVVTGELGVYADSTIDVSSTNITLKANDTMEIAVAEELRTRSADVMLLAESSFNATSGDYMTLTTYVMTVSARELTFESLRFLDIVVTEDIFMATDRTRLHMSSGGQIVYHTFNWTDPLFFDKSEKFFPRVDHVQYLVIKPNTFGAPGLPNFNLNATNTPIIHGGWSSPTTAYFDMYDANVNAWVNVYSKTIREDYLLTAEEHINVTFPQMDVQGLRLWSYGLDDLTFVDWNVTIWLGMVREPVVDVSSGDRMYLSAGEVLEVKSKDLSFESLRNLEVLSANISVQAGQHAVLNAGDGVEVSATDASLSLSSSLNAVVGNDATIISDTLAVETISSIEVTTTDASMSVDGSVTASVGEDVTADVGGLSLGASGSIDASIVDSASLITGHDGTGEPYLT